MQWEIKEQDIILNGDGFVVIHKPSGLPSQGTPDPKRDHLYAAVQRWQKSLHGNRAYVGLHHRLDRDTSGLMLFTTDRRRNIWASDLFQNRKIQKHYLAIAICPSEDKVFPVEIKNHLKKTTGNIKPQRMVVTTSGGDFAHTTFMVLERKPAKVLLRASPHTGRMHQIRVHLQGAGFPIFGDYLYGGKKQDWPQLSLKFPPRLALHAAELEFPDPDTQELVRVTTPLPEDLSKFWSLPNT